MLQIETPRGRKNDGWLFTKLKGFSNKSRACCSSGLLTHLAGTLPSPASDSPVQW